MFNKVYSQYASGGSRKISVEKEYSLGAVDKSEFANIKQKSH